MGFQPSEYYNDKITMVDENLMKIATDYFDLALWISAISAALMAIAMIFYPLTKKQHAAIVEALKKKSLEEAGEASDENAEVVLDAENGQGEILVENENNEMVEEVINIDSKEDENASESLIENDSLKSDDEDKK